MARPGREQFNVRLTPEARAVWDEICIEHGVSLTALMEALSHHVIEHPDWIPESVLREAQLIDRGRSTWRQRRPRQPPEEDDEHGPDS